MNDSLRNGALKAVRNAGCKPKVVAIGEGRPFKSWLEIYTENIEKETARKIFADIDKTLDEFQHFYEQTFRPGLGIGIDKLKKKYKVED